MWGRMKKDTTNYYTFLNDGKTRANRIVCLAQYTIPYSTFLNSIMIENNLRSLHILCQLLFQSDCLKCEFHLHPVTNLIGIDGCPGASFFCFMTRLSELRASQEEVGSFVCTIPENMAGLPEGRRMKSRALKPSDLQGSTSKSTRTRLFSTQTRWNCACEEVWGVRRTIIQIVIYTL